MADAGGYILILSKDRLDLFKKCLDWGERFAEPVPEFKHSRNTSLICFVLSDGSITHLAQGKRGFRAGTGLSRLNIDDGISLNSFIPAKAIIKHVPQRVKKWVRQCFKNGGLLTPKSFEAVVDAILHLSPETKPLLARYSSERANIIRNMPLKTRQALAIQKESVATALSIAGFERGPLQQWAPESVSQPISFLEGLPEARLREDAMVVHDLMNLPGYDLIKTMPYNAAIFEDNSKRLTVILANRQPLEQLLGTDLIYFNETYESFVMVQYKAMEKEKRGDSFRLPNQQLAKEILRMDEVLAELQKCDSNDICDGFRLNYNPFFLKLCRRIILEPDDISLLRGMYIPLDYWRLLVKDPAIIGPRGGRKVTYENVGRYFTNTDFISMVAKAWIGTTIKQSGVLETAIRHTLEAGKAVALAIKTDNVDPKFNEVNQFGAIDSEQADVNPQTVQIKLFE
jgi:hypothetical protein